MLDRLVASRPERSRGGTVASGVFAVLLHGGLATAAIIATWPAPHLPPPVFVPLDGPLYYPAARPARPAGPALPTLPSAHWTIPEVDVPSVVVPEFGALPSGLGPSAPGARPQSGGAGPGSFGPGQGGAASGDTLYAERTVDEPPVVLTHPALEYPALLRAAGVEGMVVFEVVIDSMGLAEPATLRLLATSHRGFVAAASRVVLGARFRPGRAHGRPVRVLIRQPITFRLER